jgi:hypothetical protein
MAMHPIAAAILAALIVGQPLGLHLAVGVIAVLAGIWIAANDGPKSKKMSRDKALLEYPNVVSPPRPACCCCRRRQR